MRDLRFSPITMKFRGTLEELHLWGACYELMIVPGVLNSLPHLIVTVAPSIIPILQMRTLRLRESTNLFFFLVLAASGLSCGARAPRCGMRASLYMWCAGSVVVARSLSSCGLRAQ